MLGAIRAVIALIAAGVVLDGGDAGGGLLLVLGLIGLAISVGYLVVAKHLRLGRRWAWITTLVLLVLAALVGVLGIFVELGEGAFPTFGLIFTGVPALLIVALTASRKTRDFFQQQPATAAPPAR